MNPDGENLIREHYKCKWTEYERCWKVGTEMGTNSFLTFLLTLVVFMTISCASQIQIPVDCKELLLIEGLQAKLSIPIEVEKLHHWIAQTYNLSLRDIEMADEYKGLSTLKWQTRGATYTLTVRDSMPYDVRIGFGTNGPPFGELLGCLGWGDPDYYWAFFGDTMPYGKMYTVDLYFLDEGGFVASGKGLYRAIAPPTAKHRTSCKCHGFSKTWSIRRDILTDPSWRFP